MIVYHLVLAVVWASVSLVFALLARFKKCIEGIRIWPDVLASVCACIVTITYVVQIILEVA